MTWHPLLVAILLVISAVAAGCFEDETAGPAEPQRPPLPPGQVLYDTGDVTGTGTLGGTLVSGTIDTITFTVGLASGAKPVDMEKATIIYADAIRTETLVPVQGFRGDPPDGCWGILEVKDETGGSNNRLEYEEKFVIKINPKAPLVPRQLITISVKTPGSTPLNIRRVSPPTIVQENNILTPM